MSDRNGNYLNFYDVLHREKELDVFDLRNHLITDYGSFARSFTKIKAPDLRAQLQAIYSDDRFWPEPLLQISPNYQAAHTVDELADSGDLHRQCA